MTKKVLKKPYTFSFSETFITDIQYYRRTNPNKKLDREVEELLGRLIPARNYKDWHYSHLKT